MSDNEAAVSVFMWRSGYKTVGMRFNTVTQIVNLSRDDARDLGKTLICMADLADELDKDEQK